MWSLSCPLLPRAAWPRLDRVHALLFQNRCGFGRAQEAHERLRCIALLDARKLGRAIGNVALKIARQRPEDRDAFDRQELDELLDTDLGVAACDDLSDRLTRFRRDELRLDLRGDAQPRRSRRS